MHLIYARSSLLGALAAAALCLSSNTAWAGFVLTPSSATVAAGGSFQATLSYQGTEALNWALDVTPLSASRTGFTLTGLTALAPLDSILVGPGGLPQALPAFITAFINGPVGGSNALIDLWQFDIAVDPSMTLGSVTLSASGGSAYDDFTEVFYDLSAELRIIAGGGVPVPEPGTLALLGIGLLGLARTQRRTN